jgi:thiamine-phosphate pyrophosphorylase
MKPLAECRLYTFVDAAYLRGRDPSETARQLCDGGSDIVQLRAKGLPPAEVETLAGKVLTVTRAAGIPLVINDHLSIAQKLGAEFCHLGQEDFFDAGFAHVANLPAPAVSIGLSTHSPAQAERAIAAQPAYIAAGPVYPTGTKPSTRAVTLEYVRWAAANVSLPWFAIGGINLSNLDDVLAAGASRVCVVSAILNAPDIAKQCREFRRRLP